MARTPSKPPTAADDTAAAEAAAKVAALIKFNSDALKSLKDYFGARWPKIQARCERLGMNEDQIASLAGKMLSTRTAWFPGDAASALKAAGTGFLTTIDMRDETPKPAPEPVNPPAAPVTPAPPTAPPAQS